MLRPRPGLQDLGLVAECASALHRGGAHPFWSCELNSSGVEDIWQSPVGRFGNVDQPVPRRLRIERYPVGMVDRVADGQFQAGDPGDVGPAAVVGVYVAPWAFHLGGRARPVEVGLDVTDA